MVVRFIAIFREIPIVRLSSYVASHYCSLFIACGIRLLTEMCVLAMILFVLGGNNVAIWFVLSLSMTNQC